MTSPTSRPMDGDQFRWTSCSQKMAAVHRILHLEIVSRSNYQDLINPLAWNYTKGVYIQHLTGHIVYNSQKYAYRVGSNRRACPNRRTPPF